MTFHELAGVWFPQAQEMYQVDAEAMSASVLKAISEALNGNK